MNNPVGRPRVPPEMRRRRVELSLDPGIREVLRRQPNASEYVEQLIRDDLARRVKRPKREAVIV